MLATISDIDTVNYMRRDEIYSGMPLEDENGDVVGHSPKIGKELFCDHFFTQKPMTG